MKVLLDTAVFLWEIFDQRNHISSKAQETLLAAESELYLSTGSLWEIAIKYSIGKLPMSPHPERWLTDIIQKMGLKTLPIMPAHTLEVLRLPLLHKDPFDRLLAAQCRYEKLRLLTPDRMFSGYGVNVIW